MSKIDATSNYYSHDYEDPLKFIRVDRVAKVLIENIPDKNAKILDIGCYGSHLLHNLHLNGYKNLSGLDVIPLENSYPFEFSFTQHDIETGLPYDNEIFDGIATSHVLEHLFDVVGAIEEINRVLKKGGQYVLALPFDTNLFARISVFLGKPIHNPFQLGTHIKFFKYYPTLAHFKQNGFELVYADYHSLFYGVYDSKFPLAKKIAKILPEVFASEVTFVFKKV